VAQAGPAKFVRWAARASSAVAALTGLLEQVAGLLRQLVRVVGWLCLLWGAVALLAHPSLSVGHLVAPGAGALAVLQGLVRPARRAEGDESAASPAFCSLTSGSAAHPAATGCPQRQIAPESTPSQAAPPQGAAAAGK
jgi:hypothetical protein